MEVISIDGVEYLKASTAAKRFKYTADYIGQLCRGRKVDAKLIGRTWYVNPLSLSVLKEPKASKAKKSSSSENIVDDTTKISISRTDVNSALSKKTVRSLQSSYQNHNFAKRIGWKPIAYEDDTAELIPQLQVEGARSAKLLVDLAEGHTLPVASLTDGTFDLVSENLPEVALTGNIAIHSVEDVFDYNKENIDISESYRQELPSEPVVARTVNKPSFADRLDRQRTVVSSDSTPSRSRQTLSPAAMSRSAGGHVSIPLPASESTVAITPSVSLYKSLWFWLICLLGMVFVVLLISLEYLIFASPNSFEQTFQLTAPTVKK